MKVFCERACLVQRLEAFEQILVCLDSRAVRMLLERNSVL